MATGFNLAAGLTALGVVRVFVEDPEYDIFVALPTEGAITVNAPQNLNRLTAPELTGDVAHDAWVTNGQVTVVVPVIYTGADQLRLLSATGAASIGTSHPIRPTYRKLFVIPLEEMDLTDPDAPTITYLSEVWAPEAPVNSIMFWKTVPVYPEITSSWENGGKIIIPVTFEVFFDGTKPSGHKVFTVGDPTTAGIVDFVI